MPFSLLSTINQIPVQVPPPQPLEPSSSPSLNYNGSSHPDCSPGFSIMHFLVLLLNLLSCFPTRAPLPSSEKKALKTTVCSLSHMTVMATLFILEALQTWMDKSPLRLSKGCCESQLPRAKAPHPHLCESVREWRKHRERQRWEMESGTPTVSTPWFQTSLMLTPPILLYLGYWIIYVNKVPSYAFN